MGRRQRLALCSLGVVLVIVLWALYRLAVVFDIESSIPDLAGMIVAASTAAGLLWIGFNITLYPIRPEDAKRHLVYRVLFSVLVLLSFGITVVQGFLNGLSQRDEKRERARIESLLTKQTTISEKAFFEQYQVNANLFVANNRFELQNLGQKEIFYCGNKWGSLPPDFQEKPVLIQRQSYGAFPIDAGWKAMRMRKLAGATKRTEPLTFYLRDSLMRKWVLSAEVISTVKDGTLTTVIQLHAVEMKDWP